MNEDTQPTGAVAQRLAEISAHQFRVSPRLYQCRPVYKIVDERDFEWATFDSKAAAELCVNAFNAVSSPPVMGTEDDAQVAQTILADSAFVDMSGFQQGLALPLIAAALTTARQQGAEAGTVEGALARLRERYPNAKFISISVGATDRKPHSAIRSARIQIASNKLTGAEDGGFFTKETLAEALGTALKG